MSAEDDFTTTIDGAAAYEAHRAHAAGEDADDDRPTRAEAEADERPRTLADQAAEELARRAAGYLEAEERAGAPPPTTRADFTDTDHPF